MTIGARNLIQGGNDLAKAASVTKGKQSLTKHGVRRALDILELTFLSLFFYFYKERKDSGVEHSAHSFYGVTIRTLPHLKRWFQFKSPLC